MFFSDLVGEKKPSKAMCESQVCFCSFGFLGADKDVFFNSSSSVGKPLANEFSHCQGGLQKTQL